jgi:hypothetical protein
MENFNYLIDKINDSTFTLDPFKFVYIEDFFTKDHFDRITSCKQINVPQFNSTEEMCSELTNTYKYKPQPFPGCTTSVQSYLEWYNNKDIADKVANQDLLEGYGVAFRLKKYEDSILEELVEFFNSNEWHNCIKQKFNKTGETSVDTAIQKYVSGYEISPHPDIRRKCATYMININTAPEAEHLGLHTHFMTFKDDKKWIFDEWQHKQNKDTCWVPWDWAVTQYEHSVNNSITMFAPDYNTLHAVKLDYDHTKLQRTQVYGNLWYTGDSRPKVKKMNWKKLDGV